MSWLCELIEQNSPEPRQRLELSQQFLDQLQVYHLPSDSTLLNDFCDLALQWLSGSNYKVIFEIFTNIFCLDINQFLVLLLFTIKIAIFLLR